MSANGRKTLIILAIVAIVLLVSISITEDDRYKITPLEDAVLVVFSPLQDIFMRMGKTVSTFFYTVTNYEEILEENNRLKEELAERQKHSSQLLELQKENYRLRQLLGFKSKTSFDLLPAEVIARDPSNWFEVITVNKGYNDGVEKDMPVVTSSGLLGKVSTVSRNSSQVMLLTDPRIAVSALVQRSREPGVVGIVEGYPEEPGYLQMRNIPPEGNILPGDTIISSGLGGVYPKGLVIGYVIEVGEDEYGLLQYAKLKTAANFNRLEEVFLIRSVEKEIPPGEDLASTGEDEEEKDDQLEDGGES
ncbi:MAG: rod shape-determining protein MreC [Dethiobacteria bacterium]|nr:rod shape-determining protein MreC [Bacillota bacterium]